MCQVSSVCLLDYIVNAIQTRTFSSFFSAGEPRYVASRCWRQSSIGNRTTIVRRPLWRFNRRRYMYIRTSVATHYYGRRRKLPTTAAYATRQARPYTYILLGCYAELLSDFNGLLAVRRTNSSLFVWVSKKKAEREEKQTELVKCSIDSWHT